MVMNVASAAAAYARALQAGAAPGMEARREGGGSFAELLKEAAADTGAGLRQAEQMSMKAAAREADLLEVVSAVNNAEISLQAVVAVRDRVIQAYQDIVRMPI